MRLRCRRKPLPLCAEVLDARILTRCEMQAVKIYLHRDGRWITPAEDDELRKELEAILAAPDNKESKLEDD